MSVSAEGAPDQWKKNGIDLPGETNHFVLTDANATYDGNYSVVVSNDFGSVESNQLDLNIMAAAPASGLVAWYPLDGNVLSATVITVHFMVQRWLLIYMEYLIRHIILMAWMITLIWGQFWELWIRRL